MPTITADGKYYVDLGPDYGFSNGSFISVYPENLSFDDQISGVGNCNFEISFSAEDQDGNLIVTGYDVIGPYRTYYRLRYGDVAIQAGVITTWHTRLGDDFMSVAGKTWEHFFERWQYPFNPASPNDYVFTNSFQNDETGVGSGTVTPAGLVYQCYNRDITRILDDILTQTMFIGNRPIFDLSSLGALSGVKTNFQYSLGDTSFMDSLVSDLSGIGDGLDWWISWDMKFLWASPYRFGNPSAPSIIWTVDTSNQPSNLEFENVGPAATHILGTGAGLAVSTTLAVAYGEPASEIEFTRLDESVDFGDVRNAAELDAKTHKRFSKDLNPQHNIPITLDPGRIPNFWSEFRKGRAIYIDYDLIAHKIDSPHQVLSYSTQSSDTGEILVDLTLSQIYDVSSGVGVVEA